MTDRTPTTLDAAWEALHVDLTNAWQNEGPTYYENILARHRPRIEAEARAEVTDDMTTAYMVGYEAGKAEARAPLDVDRPVERPVVATRCVCSHHWVDHTTWCDSNGCPCRFTGTADRHGADARAPLDGPNWDDAALSLEEPPT